VIEGKALPFVPLPYALNVMNALELCRESSDARRTVPWPG